MTIAKDITPETAVKSRCNERSVLPDEDDEEWQTLVQTVAEEGISNKPLARMEDGEVGIVDGWLRVKAAEEAGLDKITVLVDADMSDLEAMKKSVYGNLDESRKEITPRERALHLQRIWEAKDGEGIPSQSDLSEELGVPEPTIANWLEPLRYEWEDTVFDPTSESLHEFTVNSLQEIGTRKLASIRKTTGGGDDGEWLAKQAVEEGLTIQDLSAIRDHVEKGASLKNATKVVTGELSIAEVQSDSTDATIEETESHTETESPTQAESAASTTTTESPTVDEESEDDTNWLDQLDPVDDDSDDDDQDTDQDSLTVIETDSLTFEGQVADAVQEASAMLEMETEEFLLHAVKKYLRDGEFL